MTETARHGARGRHLNHKAHHPVKPQQGPLDTLIKSLASLPGLGPRSARRVALHLLTSRDKALMPLLGALRQAADEVRNCSVCGNLDSADPCRICADARRENGVTCVVAGVADLWAIERTGAFRGRYHILGGVLSAMDGVGPDALRIAPLLTRLQQETAQEIILALSATVNGQATAHYLTDRLLQHFPALKITRLAHGVPVGGELDYLDDGTIVTALRSRASL